MPDVVINLNFGPRVVSVPVETSQRALEIEPQSYQLEPEAIRYLIYEGLTPLDIFQYRAAAKGKGKAGKQCKTGQACGNTCISKTKTCSKGLSGAQKEKAKNAKAKTTDKGKTSPTDAGSNTGTQGGAIVLLDKKQAEETIKKPRFPGDRQSEIDDKYASVEPSDKDIDNWFKETVENLGTEKGIEAMAATDLLMGSFPMDPAAIPYLDKVGGKQSFVEAYASLITTHYGQRETVIDGKTYTANDIEYWRKQMYPFAEEVSKFERAKKILNDPKKSEEKKAKAQKEVEKYERRLEQLEQLAQMQLEKSQRLSNGDREFALKLGEDIWNNSAPKQMQDSKEFIKDLNSKSPAKREDARKFILNQVRQMTSPDYWMDPMNADFAVSYSKDGAKARLSSRADSPLKSATSKAELKKMFKEYAVKNHPDKGGNLKQFQAVSAQYQHMLTYLN